MTILRDPFRDVRDLRQTASVPPRACRWTPASS